MGKGEQSLTTVMEHHGDEEITENSSRLKWVKMIGEFTQNRYDRKWVKGESRYEVDTCLDGAVGGR